MKIEWILTIVSIAVSGYALTLAVSAYKSVTRLSNIVDKLLDEVLHRYHDMEDDRK